MPSPTREDRAQVVTLAVVVFFERIYRSAEKATGFLSHITLWPLFLLFLPKINLFTFGGETAGIRPDDVVLLIAAIVLFGGWIADLEFRVDSLAALALVVVGLFCLSNLINLGHSNVLYSLRLVEYLLFFWAGKALIRCHYDFNSIVTLLIGINCAFIFLQYGGLVGGFTAEGYTSKVGRPFGLSANHPAEMGAMLNLLFAALAFGKEVTNSRKFWFWCVLVAGCIFITESRSALVVHCILTLVFVYRHARNKAAFVLRSAIVSGLLVAVFALVPNSLRDRSADLLSAKNLEAARQLYDRMPAEKQFKGFTEGGAPEDAPEDVDTSWYMRGFKWTYVIKIMFTAPWTLWILGLGPGALGPALDGGWLRLLAECGVVGTIAFLVLMWKISRVSRACAMVVFALGLNMLMVDSQNAYKVMAVLFLIAGIEVQRKLQASNSEIAANESDSPSLA